MPPPNTARRVEPRPAPAATTPPPVTVLPVLPEGIMWEEPAPVTTGRRADPIVTADVAAALKSHPGKWAKVKVYKSRSGAHSAATSINSKKRRLGPGWEAAGRGFGATGSFLYLRYIGEPS